MSIKTFLLVYKTSNIMVGTAKTEATTSVCYLTILVSTYIFFCKKQKHYLSMLFTPPEKRNNKQKKKTKKLSFRSF